MARVYKNGALVDSFEVTPQIKKIYVDSVDKGRFARLRIAVEGDSFRAHLNYRESLENGAGFSAVDTVLKGKTSAGDSAYISLYSEYPCASWDADHKFPNNCVNKNGASLEFHFCADFVYNDTDFPTARSIFRICTASTISRD